MSCSNLLASDQKINLRYLPNPYPYPSFPSPLGAVLTVGNQAGDQDIVGLDQLEVRKVVQQQGLLGEFLQIGDASGGDLRIHGATTKGSLLAGNGTSTVELPLGATGYVLKSNPSTLTGLEWAIDISGVTGVVGVNAGVNIDISGTVSQPIVSLQSPLTSTLNMGAVALQDISGATGTSGQFLSAGVGGQAKWSTPAYPVVSVVGGANIDVSGTTTSTVSLANPFNAGADIGTQQVQGAVGDITMDLMGDHLNYVNTTTGFNGSYTPTQIGFSDQVGDVFTSLDNLTLNFTDNGNSAVASLGADAGLGIKPTPLGASGTELTSTKLEIIKEDPVALTIETTTANKDGFFTITEQTPAGSGEKGTSAIASNTTQGEVSVLYQNQTGGGAGTYQGIGNIITTATASTMTIQASNISPVVSNQQLIVECPAVGDARIEHTYGGSTQRNLDITTQGKFSVLASGTGGFVIETPLGGFQTKMEGTSSGELAQSGSYSTFSSNRVGGVNSPSYTFDNNNSTAGGFPAIKINRSLGNFVAGNTIGTISMWGNDASGVSREWSRIQTKTENVTASNQDGTLSIFNSVNGSVVETFNFNGGQNENNSFRPLDMNGNGIRSTSGDMTISTLPSTGTGFLSVQAKDYAQLGGEQQYTNIYNTNGNINLTAGGASSDLVLTCPNWESATANAFSGKHLRIKLNGVYYKIALLDD